MKTARIIGAVVITAMVFIVPMFINALLNLTRIGYFINITLQCLIAAFLFIVCVKVVYDKLFSQKGDKQ